MIPEGIRFYNIVHEPEGTHPRGARHSVLTSGEEFRSVMQNTNTQSAPGLFQALDRNFIEYRFDDEASPTDAKGRFEIYDVAFLESNQGTDAILGLLCQALNNAGFSDESETEQPESPFSVLLRGAVPESITTEDGITHSAILKMGRRTYTIVAHGITDKLIEDFLEDQSENTFLHQTADKIRGNKALNDRLQQLINPALGIDDLAEEIDQRTVKLHWSGMTVRHPDGYLNTQDILYVIRRSANQVGVVGLIGRASKGSLRNDGNEDGESAVDVFNEAAWLVLPGAKVKIDGIVKNL